MEILLPFVEYENGSFIIMISIDVNSAPKENVYDQLVESNSAQNRRLTDFPMYYKKPKKPQFHISGKNIQILIAKLGFKFILCHLIR